MPTPMTRSAFARIMSVHKSQVTRWISAGMPTLDNGDVDAEAASHWVNTRIDPRRRIYAAREHAGRIERQQREVSQLTPESRPACTDHLAYPADCAIVATLPILAYRTPALAACMAVAAGASMASVYALFRAMKMAAMMETAEILEGLDVPPPPDASDWNNAGLWTLDRFAEPDWDSLAASRGEKADIEGWEAHLRTLSIYQEPEPAAVSKRQKSGQAGRAQ